MIKNLKFEVTFPSTGRTIKQDLKFNKGFTAITGPNEVGKSLIFEMIRFGLFGAAALRGVGDDYKTLKMEMSFTLRGVGYVVDRTMRKALLKREGVDLASGVSVVNAKVVELFGFGLSVFDVACSINQGEVERLGSMTPSERKKLIDGVLGIEALDTVSRWAMEEARAIDRDVEIIKRSLVQPVMPEVPAGYVETSTFDIPALQATATELAQLNGWLAHTYPEPVMPVTSLPEATELTLGSKERRELRDTLADLDARMKPLGTSAPYTNEQLDEIEVQWGKFARYEQAQSWLTHNPRPQYNLEEVEAAEAWAAWDKIQTMIASLDHQLSHLDTVDCPECSHNFLLDREAFDKLQAERDKLLTVAMPTQHRPVAIADVYLERSRIATYKYDLFRLHNSVPSADKPECPYAQIPALRAAIEQVILRKQLFVETFAARDEFMSMPDYESQLLERLAYDKAMVIWTSEAARYEAWEAEFQVKSARRKEISDADIDLREASSLYQVCRDYELALQRFGTDFDFYNRNMADCDVQTAEAIKHRKVKELMNVLRSMIKQHLMPSLNKVASHLIDGMTGGQRTHVFVDEDFNVLVDGQNLNTLSGSGKACANLAIRIALGQVLTNRVFSVLLADEIDASMDDFRAENTSNILGNLKDSISQIMLVSHKPVEAINQICLGGYIEDQGGNS